MIVFNKPKSTQTEQTTACIRGKCLSKVLLLTSFNQNHFRHVLLHHLPQVQNVEATRRPDRGEAEEKRFGLNNNNEEVSLTPSRLFSAQNKEEVIIKLQQRKSA